MMHTSALHSGGVLDRGTAYASPEGLRFYRLRLPALGSLRSVDSTAVDCSLEERLADALAQAKEAIRNSVRDLTPEQATSLSTQVAELLDAELWDEDDEVLKVASVHTLIRLMVAAHAAPGDLTISRSGHLVVTWSEVNGTLRVEALSGGRVSWARLANGEATHRAEDTIPNLLLALQG